MLLFNNFWKNLQTYIKSDVFKQVVYVFIFCIVLNIVIFRDVLANYPSVWNGNSTIATDELVPIIDFQSQFIDQQLNPFSPLTSNFEFRVRYSILTTWTRYYLVLPFALVFLNSISLFLIFISVKRILKVFGSFSLETDLEDVKLNFSALTGALISYFILLQSKVTHFYTLIFGFALFSLVVAFQLDVFANFKKYSKKQLLKYLSIIVLLSIFNPATHYVILGLFLSGTLIIIDLIYVFVKSFVRGGFIRENFYKSLYFIICILTTGFLFGLYYVVYITSFNSFAVSELVSLTKTILVYASSTPLQIFSLQTGSVLDFYTYNDYQIIPETGRQLNLIYSAILLVLPFIFLLLQKRIKSLSQNKVLIPCLLLVLGLVAAFFSLGLSLPYSAHNIAGNILNFLTQNKSSLGDVIIRAISTFFLVLRFPHRFLFLYEVVISFSIGIFTYSILSFFENITKFHKTILKYTIPVMTLTVIIVPYLAGETVLENLLSGNLNGFLSAYEIPTDLKNIKKYLKSNPGKRLVVLPSSEIPFRVSPGANQNSVKLIDKFLIYYLDYPSLYYGLSADIKYKNDFFLTYLNILEEKEWINFIRNRDIQYILVNNKQYVKEGIIYRNTLEEKIKKDTQKYVEKGYLDESYKGEDYSLFSLKSEYRDKKTSLYFNNAWNSTQERFSSKEKLDLTFTPEDLSDEICKQNSFYMLGSKDKNLLDLISLCQKKYSKYDSRLIPFLDNVDSTDSYSSNVFSLLSSYDSPLRNRFNTLNSISPGTYNSLFKSVTYLKTSGTKFSFDFKLDSDSQYDLNLRARLVNSRVRYTVEKTDGTIVLEKIQNFIDTSNTVDSQNVTRLDNFKYFNLAKDQYLEKGNYRLEIEKLDDNVIGVDILNFHTKEDENQALSKYEVKTIDAGLFYYQKKN